MFLLPVLNPASAVRITSDAVNRGLSIFKHHLRAFGAYWPRSVDPNVPAHVDDAVRLNTYIHDGLSHEEYARFFPCIPRRGPSKK